MSKIVRAINAMIANKRHIDCVLEGYDRKELFFLYDKKHKWSIYKDSKDDYSLHLYPGDITLEELSQIPDIEWEDFNIMVTYRSEEIGTLEAYESFSELYTIVKEKIFGIDTILDAIIEDHESIL